ncbi:LysR substrate-binding domain-containing protein [Plastoroseomonas hellenica]|uniref:LysR substrate-binding domain-containing protein n=1 Tax=Plastoroseomonas hellenica TaxID=2687306 RepID=UPI001BACAEA4|nr:LysR substrate-binding domain-containing protein [Plastoroseomonas hellenica]MBR0644869.1 LysR family transcriptional regulator [Plastoroseomonas hellenica]
MPQRFLDQRLKLSLLRVADALDTHGSLLKASAALSLGQPALTRSLRELEDITGAVLFERHPRGVRPTAAGVAVIRVARRVLGELRRMEHELDAIGAVEGGSIAVGVLPVAAVGVLPGALIALRATHPGLRVRLQQGRTEELLPLLAARELDLVVGRLYAPAVPDGLQRLPMWEEPIAVLARAGHPLLRRRGAVTAAALAEHEMVLPTISQRVGQEIEHLLALLGLPQDVPLRSSSYGFIREMLLASDAISIMPRSMMVGDLLRGALQVVPLPVPAPPRPAGIILAADPPPTPAVSAFIEALRTHLAAIEAHGFGGMPNADTERRRSDRTGRHRRS